MSIYCGRCGDYGHNAPHCPQMKHRAAEYHRKVKAGEDTSYRERDASRYRERIDAAQANRSRNRVCGYCSESGHNRATCPTRLGDVQDFIKADKLYRRSMVEFLRKEGFGIGALLMVQHSYYDKQNKWREYSGPAILQNLNWSHLTLASALNLVGTYTKAMQVNIPVDGAARMNFPSLIVGRWRTGALGSSGETFYDCFCTYPSMGDGYTELLAPSARISPPEGWLGCKDIHPKKFAKSKEQGQKLSGYVQGWRGNGFKKYVKAKTDIK